MNFSEDVVLGVRQRSPRLYISYSSFCVSFVSNVLFVLFDMNEVYIYIRNLNEMFVVFLLPSNVICGSNIKD